MRAGIFDLVEPEVLLEAGRRVFGLRCHRFFESELTFDRTLSEAVARLSREGALEALVDTPALRAWMWAVRRLRLALLGSGDSLPMDALGHLHLDDVRGDRVSELLVHQFLGILAGQALLAGKPFKHEEQFAAPQDFCLDGVGLVTFGPVGTKGRFEVETGDGSFVVGNDEQSARFRVGVAGRQGTVAFTPTLNARARDDHVAELAFLNPSLSQSVFQPFPQLAGLDANRLWLDDINICCESLAEAELPHIRFVVAQCKAMVGLVSMTDAIGSGSREEALGLVYLPVGASHVDLAECILHEGLHQLLFRIEEASALFDSASDATERYYSPWRTDPRSLRMVLHGAFVFSGVATLHQLWLRTPPKDGRFRGDEGTAYRRLSESVIALETLKQNAVLTSIGLKVVNAIDSQLRHVAEGTVLDSAEQAKIRADIRAKRDAVPSYVG